MEEKITKSNIQKRLTDLIIDRDITQIELSIKTGLTQAQISRLLNGKHTPNWMTLHKLNKYFGLDG